MWLFFQKFLAHFDTFTTRYNHSDIKFEFSGYFYPYKHFIWKFFLKIFKNALPTSVHWWLVKNPQFCRMWKLIHADTAYSFYFLFQFSTINHNNLFGNNSLRCRSKRFNFLYNIHTWNRKLTPKSNDSQYEFINPKPAFKKSWIITAVWRKNYPWYMVHFIFFWE